MLHRDIDVVVFACQGTLLDLGPALEAVVYDAARRNGESPMDRGRALRARLERLARSPLGPSLARGFDRLATERGWRRAGGGSAAVARAAALTRVLPDALPAVEALHRAGLHLVAVSHADRRLVTRALRPFDGALDAVLTSTDLGGPPASGLLAAALSRLPTCASRVLHVSASGPALRAGLDAGVAGAWIARSARHAPPAGEPVSRWSTLPELADSLLVPSRPLQVLS